MKGTNTTAAVKRAEKKRCPTCKADPGEPCITTSAVRMTAAARAKGFGRTGKPHAARLRAAGIIQ